MGIDNTKPLGRVIGIDEGRIGRHVSELVRGSVEKTLNELLDAEADALCNAPKYSRSPERMDTRAGHYTRKLHTGAGEVEHVPLHGSSNPNGPKAHAPRRSRSAVIVLSIAKRNRWCETSALRLMPA